MAYIIKKLSEKDPIWGELWAPMLLCDACGKEITDPPNAVVVWQMDGVLEESPPMFAHKGICHDTLNPRGERGRGWEGLTRHLSALVHNTRMYSFKRHDPR